MCLILATKCSEYSNGGNGGNEKGERTRFGMVLLRTSLSQPVTDWLAVMVSSKLPDSVHVIN